MRARIAVLSQCPERWAALVAELTAVTGVAAPDPQLAWSAWQSAYGCAELPADELSARLEPALLKAVREAGLFTSWTEPDPVYERTVTDFVAAGPGSAAGAARTQVAEFADALAPHVRAQVLGAALVHLTMPGVPDLYQGTESEYLALVDPDNRRPFRRPEAPDEKQALTAAALVLRRELPEVFGESGTYAPLTARGPAAPHLLSFCRSGEVITAVTRLSLRLAEGGGWRDTVLELPDGGAWRDLLSASPDREFTGGAVAAAELFAERPVALLRRVRD